MVDQAGSAAAASGWRRYAPLTILLVLLGLCMLGGGASRADVASLVYLRPAAIICVALLLLLSERIDTRLIRAPLLLLALLALLLLVQLIPLPPALWSWLPGHERYAGAELIGAPVWRPISLTPDLTISSLMTLLFPLAGLLAYAAMPPDHRQRLLPVLIISACVSGLFGIVQVTGNPDGAAFLYNVTHEGSAVGFFANRNHQAALLAAVFPMLRAWTLMPHPDPAYRRMRTLVAFGIGLLLIPLLLITGSRAGVVLGAAGIIAAYAMTPRHRHQGRFAALRRAGLMILVPLAVASAVIFLGRALSIDRLAAPGNFAAETRLEYMPLTLRIAGDFFPVGTGFGAFDAVFQGYEPDATLNPQYLNHAHNDLIELIITGGLPALVLFGVFLIWGARQTIRALRRETDMATLFLSRLGAAMIMMFFLASLVDYPLRTPLLALIFAILCGWLCEARPSRPPSALAENPESPARL